MSQRDPDKPQEPGRGPQETGFDSRLDALSARIAAERRQREAAMPAANRGSANATGYAIAARLAAEFVAGILVGGGLGWLFDSVAGTSPWGLIILLLAGFGAGIMNMARAGRQAERDARNDPAVHRPPPADDDDEDDGK